MSTWRTWRGMPLIGYLLAPCGSVNRAASGPSPSRLPLTGVSAPASPDCARTPDEEGKRDARPPRTRGAGARPADRGRGPGRAGARVPSRLVERADARMGHGRATLQDPALP